MLTFAASSSPGHLKPLVVRRFADYNGILGSLQSGFYLGHFKRLSQIVQFGLGRIGIERYLDRGKIF